MAEKKRVLQNTSGGTLSGDFPPEAVFCNTLFHRYICSSKFQMRKVSLILCRKLSFIFERHGFVPVKAVELG